MFSFCFKVRDVGLFLSCEHVEATAGLLGGLMSLLLCLREQGGLTRGGDRDGRWVERSAHTFIKLSSYVGVVGGGKAMTIVTSEITDHKPPRQIKWENYQNVTDTK